MIRRAVQDGNWSRRSTWDAGAPWWRRRPGHLDTVEANGHEVTIDRSIRVRELRNQDGGSFEALDGITIRANVAAGATTCLYWRGLRRPWRWWRRGQPTLTIVGNVTSGGGGAGVQTSGMVGLTIEGNLTSLGFKR